MKRLAPRPLSLALGEVTGRASPATLLARVQGVWAAAAGAAVAAEAEPVSERAGVVTVRCASAVWAQELDLLADELLEKLRAALGEAGGPRGLRFEARAAKAP